MKRPDLQRLLGDAATGVRPLPVLCAAALVALALAAGTAHAAVPTPIVSWHYKVFVPYTSLDGGTATLSLAGPPPGVEVLQATWFVNYKSPHGGTPASDLVLELSLTGLPPMVVTGADLGWPATVGTFSGSFISTSVTGDVQDGQVSPPAELFIHSNNGGVLGSVSAVIQLELAAICQKDTGKGGPGHVQLSICGDLLASGGHADLVVDGAPPFAPMVFLASLTAGPLPFKGGMLVPKPRLLTMVTHVGASGSLLLDVPGGGAHVTFFLQVAVADSSQANGFALSNALIVELFP